MNFFDKELRAKESCFSFNPIQAGGGVIFARGRNFFNNSKKNEAIVTKLLLGECASISPTISNLFEVESLSLIHI